MKLQTKFGLGIIIVFTILAVSIALICIHFVNKNTIVEAEHRVEVYIKDAWTIHNCKIARILSVLEVLSEEQEIKNLLLHQDNQVLLVKIKEKLEFIRKKQNMDILNLLDSKGGVIFRTRSPYHEGDLLSNDTMVNKIIMTKKSSKGITLLSPKRLKIEGDRFIEHCRRFGGEPRGMLIGSAVPIIVNGDLRGILQMGNLLNGATAEVDRIKEGVFENKHYKGKPIGTATIFMGDLRISTNVMKDNGQRAIGTRVSKEVAEQVLKKGLSWTGRAWVVDAWYLSQYDPIKDPENKIIGMLYVGELEQKYLDMRTKAVITNLSVIFFGMVLAFLVSFLIVRGMLKPIQKLSYATNRLAHNDLSHRVVVNTKDEVGNLALSFNQMAGQLQMQSQAIKDHERALINTNQELKTINRNYMEMLGFVSHELKNPLSSAIMGLFTVKDGYLGKINSSQKKGLESVAQSLEYFHDMIKNYLDLSRLEKGELKVNKKSVALNSEVVMPILKELEHELIEKMMKVENQIPRGLKLTADSNLLMIVYDNLISNAIKYGREGGRVVLSLQEEKDKINLSVYNEGKGIPHEKMGLLFKKFSRIDTPEYAGKKGTGLGLFICKEIIEKHRGKIWAESEVGKWIKFSFTLPKLTRRRDDEKENIGHR